MKKLMIFFMALSITFTLSACTETEPSLTLNGESEITINVGDEFNDPGAVVPEGFDIEITTTSDVDTKTPGTYTIKYSFEYEGKTYEATRTVIVEENGVIVTPFVTLNGDTDIYINLYDEYVELGATLNEEFQGDITITGEVHTETLGDYDVIYSYVYEGVTYQATRTVHVVDFYSYLTPLNIQFNITEKTENTITSVVTFDSLENVENLTLVLYNGDTEQARQTVTTSGDSITFDNLETNHQYTVKLIGHFDNGTISFDLPENYLDVKTTANSDYEINLKDELISSYSYGSTLTIDDQNSVLSNIKIVVFNQTDMYVAYEEDVFIDEFTIDLEGLYPEEEYKVFVQYTFTDPNTLQTEEKDQLLSIFTTPAIPVPSVNSHECTATATSITCSIDLNDDQFSNIQINQYIYLDGQPVTHHQTSNNESFEFTGLSSNTAYTVRFLVSYTDTETNQTYTDTKILEVNVTTESAVQKQVPTVENFVVTEDITSSSKSLTFTFNIVDPDNTITGTRVFILYINGSSYRKAVNVGENTIIYTNGIHENTSYDYEIQVDYMPSEDQYINRYKLIEGNFITSINMAINEFFSYDTLWYQETGIVEIILNNSVEADISSVVINNHTYDNILFLSTPTHLYVDLGILSSVGDQTYNIEGFNVTLEDGTTRFIASTKSLTVKVHERGTFIPDDATINVIKISTNDYAVETDLDSPTEITVTFLVENEFNLPITEVSFDGQIFTPSEFTYNGNFITLTVEVDHYQNNYYFSHIKFMKNNEEITYKNNALKTLMVYGYYSDEVVNISTVEQFLNMNESGKYYRLVNDLDFTGIQYTPIGDYNNAFGGCFDGNGYTIKNITITNSSSSDTESKYVGIFAVSSGLILDLTIENINITVNNQDNDQVQYIGTLSGKHLGSITNVHVINSTITVNGFEAGYLGGLVGKIDHYNGRIKDTTVQTTISIDAKGYTPESTYSYETCIGGITGHAYRVDIEASSSTGSIDLTNADNRQGFDVGGIVGYIAGTSEQTKTYLINSYSTIDINVINNYYGRTGGLAGKTGNIEYNVIIMNSYAAGSVSTTAGKIGGISGYGGELVNSMAFGDLYNVGAVPGAVMGSGGYVNEALRKPMFIYLNQTVYNSDNPSLYPDDLYVFNFIYVPDGVLNTQEFFINYLNWSSYIYDFNNLNVENEELPTHK